MGIMENQVENEMEARESRRILRSYVAVILGGKFSRPCPQPCPIFPPKEPTQLPVGPEAKRRAKKHLTRGWLSKLWSLFGYPKY